MESPKSCSFCCCSLNLGLTKAVLCCLASHSLLFQKLPLGLQQPKCLTHSFLKKDPPFFFWIFATDFYCPGHFQTDTHRGTVCFRKTGPLQRNLFQKENAQQFSILIASSKFTELSSLILYLQILLFFNLSNQCISSIISLLYLVR